MSKGEMYYEPPFRPPFEYTAACVWFVSGLLSLGITLVLRMPHFAGLVAAVSAWAVAGLRYSQGHGYALARERLREAGKLWFMTPSRAAQWYAWARAKNQVWLGEGFDVTPRVAEKIRFVSSAGLGEALGESLDGDMHGASWIQQVEEPSPVLLNTGDMDGHILVVGSTGTGKTRLFDHFLTQAIQRGEPVIALDPKGDHDMEKIMRDAYARMGCPEKFAAFRPSRPEDSVRIDPLSSWTRTSEIASRVAALVDADGTFLAFVWRVLNNLVQGELLVGRKPNLLSLRRLVERGVDDLVMEVLREWCHRHAQQEEYQGYVNNAKTKKGQEVHGYIEFYQRVLAKRAPSLAVEGLIADFEHDKEHFGKMVVSLTPILTMLTTPPLDRLLSPQPTPGDSSEITTLDKIVKQKRGLYVSLSSMADPIVGSAIGAILLADLAALAGERYDSGEQIDTAINLLGDEIAEITNAQLTQILNKGRGARVRALIATQTLSDLVVRLGGKPQALQQIGNANNVIVLRVQDPDTAELLAKALPRYEARSVKRSYSQSIQPSPGDVRSGGYSEGLESEEVDLFTPDMLMRLPPLHYVARFADGRIIKARFPIVGEPR